MGLRFEGWAMAERGQAGEVVPYTKQDKFYKPSLDSTMATTYRGRVRWIWIQ